MSISIWCSDLKHVYLLSLWNRIPSVILLWLNSGLSKLFSICLDNYSSAWVDRHSTGSNGGSTLIRNGLLLCFGYQRISCFLFLQSPFITLAFGILFEHINSKKFYLFWPLIKIILTIPLIKLLNPNGNLFSSVAGWWRWLSRNGKSFLRFVATRWDSRVRVRRCQQNRLRHINIMWLW